MKRILATTIVALAGFTAEAADKDRGAALYKLCSTCHGEKGEGKQIETLSLPAIAGLHDWYVEAQLTKFQDGRRGAHANDKKGLLMRPMSRTLTKAEDIKAVAQYVAGLPRRKSAKRIEGDLKNGKYYYDSICASCHGDKFQGNPDPSIAAPSHKPLDDWYMVEQLKKFQSGIRGAHAKDAAGAKMRPIVKDILPQLAQTKDSSTEQAIKDVVAYIYSKRD